MAIKKINLGENEKSFLKNANSIFNEIHKENPSLPTETKRAVTTMLAIIEIQSDEEDESDFLDRANDYARLIADFIKRHGEVSNTLDGWLTLLSVVFSKNKGKKKSLEVTEEDLVNAAAEGTTIDIVRSLGSEERGVVKMVIKGELNGAIRDSGGRVRPEVVNEIMKNKSLVIKELKQTRSSSKLSRLFSKIFPTLLSLQSAFLMRGIIRSAMPITHKFMLKSNLENILNPIKKFITRTITNKLYKKRSLSKAKEQSKIKFQRDAKAEIAFNMFHSHDPKRYVKIPSTLVNNHDLKREARRLNRMGMKPMEAANKVTRELRPNFQQAIAHKKAPAKTKAFS